MQNHSLKAYLHSYIKTKQNKTKNPVSSSWSEGSVIQKDVPENSEFVFHCNSQTNSRSHCLMIYTVFITSKFRSLVKGKSTYDMRIGRSLTFVVHHCDIIISLCFGNLIQIWHPSLSAWPQLTWNPAQRSISLSLSVCVCNNKCACKEKPFLCF